MKWAVLCTAGITVLLGTVFVSRETKGTTDPLHLVEPQRALEAVAALGQLTPLGEVRVLAAPTSGFGGTPRILQLLVNEGEQVSKGQVLAIFDNLPGLLAELDMSTARLEALKNNIEFQNREIMRYKKTSSEGASSLALLEEKKDKLITLKGRRNEIIAEIKGLEVDLDYAELKSPINGTILRINSREGERPGTDGVLEVGSNQDMQAVIEVYESDINRIKLSQQVLMISENGGFSGNLFGEVVQISPQVRQRKVLSTDPTGDADARIVEVRVNLDPVSSSLVTNYSGMKVIARFQP